MKIMNVDLVEKLNKLLFQLTGIDDVKVEVPADLSHGDLTTNVVMHLAAQKKQPPLDLAEELIKQLEADKLIKSHFDKVVAVKPGFINFYYSQNYLKNELKEIVGHDNYGKEKIGKGKTIVVEYSSPNTNKPLHVGHLRNNAIGMSLVRIFKFLGYRVIKTDVINDRGIHIMKSLLAYDKWGQGQTPTEANIKSDKFVGDFYVKYGQAAKDNPAILDEARVMLRQWEAKDRKVRELWQQMNQWVYDGWQQTYKMYGSEFDVDYYESDLYDKGREIIKAAQKKALVYKNKDGALVVDLSKYGLGGRNSGEKVLLRADGTTVYMTQDIYLAKNRFDKFKFDKMIYVVGDEQIYHFQVLFKLLKLLGFEWVSRCYHYAHGQVILPEGRMKSREGKVVDADDLMQELTELAKFEVKKRRSDASDKEMDEIAFKVAMAAIKYWFLKSNPKSLIHFNPKESIDFEGNTGPYLLYTFVRLNSILKKAQKVRNNVHKSEVPAEELELIRKMVVWPYLINDFSTHLNTNIVCEYLYKLSSSLNSYYHSVPVLKAEADVKDLRLQVILAGSKILKTGLELLNIKTLEKM